MTTALALFDFDNTITTQESMPEFVRRSVSSRRLLLAQILLTPIVLTYRLGVISSILLRSALVRIVYSGVPATLLESAGQDFARDYLPHILREEAAQRIAWHKAQGHTVAVVSGALDFYLRPWCIEHGIDLICSSLEARHGV